MSEQMREARRRRILENSEARYQRILGLSKEAPVLEEKPKESTQATPPAESHLATSKANNPTPLEQTENDTPQIRQRIHANQEPEISAPTNIPDDGVLTDEKTSSGQNALDQAPDTGKNISLKILVFTAISAMSLLFLGYGQFIGNVSIQKYFCKPLLFTLCVNTFSSTERFSAIFGL